MPATVHPTKNALIEATRELLGNSARKEISSDQILIKSGISKGSLYHHFEDLEELIEAALILRYTEWVDASIGAITQVIRSVKSPDDVYKSLVEITKQTQDPARRSDRARLAGHGGRWPYPHRPVCRTARRAALRLHAAGGRP